MSTFTLHPVARACAAAVLVSSLAACGGGDSSPAPTPSPAPAPAPAPSSTTVSGSVVKGPVAGAQVCAYTVSGSARGTALGSCTTADASGKYSFAVPAGSGPLWLEATGGSYVDEATGATVTLPAGAPLLALVNATGSTASTMLTPLTTLALNAARATVGTSGTLDAVAFANAAAKLLASFKLPTTLDISATAPAFGTAINDYGTALTVISKMLASGLKLSDLLAVTDPATLAAAYAAAAAPAPAPTPTPPTTPPTVPVPTTALVISAASVSSWNGTLDLSQTQFEHGSSSGVGGPYDSAQPYCRVAVYGLVNPVDNGRYFIEVPFRKDNRAAGLVVFGSDASFATLAREANPTAGISIDTVNRRITFTNLVIGSTSTTGRITLNGTLSYPTNIEPANRAACG